MEMKCPYCGRSVSRATRLCTRCGEIPQESDGGRIALFACLLLGVWLTIMAWSWYRGYVDPLTGRVYFRAMPLPALLIGICGWLPTTVHYLRSIGRQ